MRNYFLLFKRRYSPLTMFIDEYDILDIILIKVTESRDYLTLGVDFMNMVIAKSNFYEKKTDEELKNLYIQSVVESSKKTNITNYSFTTNYNFHAEVSGMLEVMAARKKAIPAEITTVKLSFLD